MHIRYTYIYKMGYKRVHSYTAPFIIPYISLFIVRVHWKWAGIKKLTADSGQIKNYVQYYSFQKQNK